MNIIEAQKDMRISYLGGSTGAIVSGLVWVIAGVSSLLLTQSISILIFFIGGMFIFPLSVLLSKALKRSGKHKKENPLSVLAMESTLILFIGLFIAYSIFQTHSNFFFPIMLLIIGVRYIIFQSIYGMKLYWVFGITLTIAGVICLLSNQPFHMTAIIGGIIELIFAILIFNSEKNIKL